MTVQPQAVVDHVVARGFKLTDIKLRYSDVYERRKGKRRFQVTVPRTAQIDDYPHRIAFAAAVVADFENRDVDDVLDEFVAASAENKPLAEKKTAAG